MIQTVVVVIIIVFISFGKNLIFRERLYAKIVGYNLKASHCHHVYNSDLFHA